MGNLVGLGAKRDFWKDLWPVNVPKDAVDSEGWVRF